MRYISIDIETTGLNPETCQVLSIGAVIEDTDNIMPVKDLPTFHGVVLSREISGDPYALNMNKDLIELMVRYQTSKTKEDRNLLEGTSGMKFYDKNEIVEAFYYWLAQNDFIPWNSGGYVKMENGKMLPAITNSTKPVNITVAGKNFGTFDLKFLEKLPRWKQLIRVRQRILDPSILYVDWKEDNSLPGLGLCKKRANLPEEVAHDAVEDAVDVILLLRKEYNPGY
jgi:DNA polymerase III epsilon subunit-like protein